jgi:hypothetical protein
MVLANHGLSNVAKYGCLEKGFFSSSCCSFVLFFHFGDVTLMGIIPNMTRFWKIIKKIKKSSEKSSLHSFSCLNLVNFLLGCDQIWQHLQKSTT